jgi:hypothetical protein
LSDKNKTVITKENLISMISEKCIDDFISIDDLLKLIDKATDEYGVISKKRLIRSIRNFHTKTAIKNIYSTLENIVFESLHSVDKKNDICIKLFEGISIDGKYVPEKTKKNNFTGEIDIVESRIKPKFNVTRSYCDKLNNK